MNFVVLDGQALSEPDFHVLPGGSRVARFVLAIGETIETSTQNCVMIKAWNETADEAAERVKKGSLLRVEGSLKRSDYTGIKEISAYPTYVVAKRMTYY